MDTVSNTNSTTTATNTTPPRQHSPTFSVPRGGDRSPWTRIVRGIDSESSSSPSPPERMAEDSSDRRVEGGEVDGLLTLESNGEGVAVSEGSSEGFENGGSKNGGKKPVWNKPTTPSDVVPEVSPLMGVAAWPALSESTKASPKSSDSVKNVPEVSSFVSQGTGMSSSSPRQGANTNTNPSSQTNHTTPTRQRSFRKGNGGGSGNHSNNMTTNGGFSLAPSSQGVGVELALNNNGRPANLESVSEENIQREGGGQRGGFGPQSNSGAEHQQRNSYRRGTGGPNPRGNGFHYNNQGGRRDQDRGNQDRNPHRNFGGRGAHMQPQRGSPRPFIRGPPHANTTYAPPLFPVHPSFGTPMVYPGPEGFYFPGPYQDPFRVGPMVPPMGPVFYPFVDPVLQTNIVNQIEYYFSTDNLVGDTYLRKNMDEQGWVSVKLVAGFKKLSQLTDNIQLILSLMQASRVVEVEGEKMRRRDDWERWIIPPPVKHSDVSSTQSADDTGPEMLAGHLQNVALDESSVKNVDLGNNLSRSSTGEFSR